MQKDAQNFQKQAQSLEQNLSKELSEILPKNGEISKDINATIDEFAKTAKIVGENLEKLGKDAPKIIDDFAKRNAGKIDDLAKKGEQIVRDINGSISAIEKDLMELAKDANSSFGEIIKGFGIVIKDMEKNSKISDEECVKDLKI